MSDNSLSRNERLLAFVEQMARLSTPTDPDKVAIFFKMNPIFCYGMMKDEIEEAIISDLPNAYDDALAFYDLIRTARELTSTDEPAEVLEVTL